MRAALRALPALAALALALAAPAQARIVSSCSERGSTTLRENSVARVYEVPDEGTYTCSKRTGRREWIADDTTDELWQLRLRGHYFGFAYNLCLDALGDECDRGVRVEDVRNSRIVFSELVPWNVHQVALKRNGSVAWSTDEGSLRAIYKHDARGRRRLDRGRDVRPSTLTLRDSRLSWRRGSARRTATLR